MTHEGVITSYFDFTWFTMASLLCCSLTCSLTLLRVRVCLCVYVDKLSRKGCIVIMNDTKISKSTDTGTVDIINYQYYSLKSFCTGPFDTAFLDLSLYH